MPLDKCNKEYYESLTAEALIKDLKEMIEKSLHITYELTDFNCIPIGSLETAVSKTNREKIGTIAETYKCLDCNIPSEFDDTQNWICDHIPPVGVNEDLRQFLLVQLEDAPSKEEKQRLSEANKKKWGAGYWRLYPSCDKCQVVQSQLVKDANNWKPANYWREFADLPPEEQRLLAGQRKREFILTNHKTANDNDSNLIQEMGRKQGCHVCGSKYPRRIYISDHYPSAIFMTHYMEKVCELVGVELPAFVAKPQCHKCSSKQTSYKAIDIAGRVLMEKKKLTTYKE